MAHIAPRDLATAGALAAKIATRRCDDASLAGPLAEVARAVDARAVIVFSVRNRPGGLELERLDVAGGLDPRLFASAFERHLAAQREDGAALAGELTQRRCRNRFELVDPRTDLGGLWSKLLAPFGLHHHQVLRALVEDDQPLGWIATVHRGMPPSTVRRRLAALVPPLRERLAFDRRIARQPLVDDLAEVLLEQMPHPAFAIGRTGRVELANGGARAWLQSDPGAATAALLDALAGRPGGRSARTLRLASVTLVRFESPDADARLDMRVERAAERWQLTPRQRDVLRLLARGCTNAAIAAQLGISARAVELHVTAILDGAAVDNRASLVARVLAND